MVTQDLPCNLTLRIRRRLGDHSSTNDTPRERDQLGPSAILRKRYVREGSPRLLDPALLSVPLISLCRPEVLRRQWVGRDRRQSGCFSLRTRTTMSAPRLPPELLDHIIDLLPDSRAVLGNCCLISKSWVPRTRRHLFANIRFDTVERLRLWKVTFSDPSTSPAKYAKTLLINCTQAVTAADAEAGGWIRDFSYVERLEVSGESTYTDGSTSSLLPFHGFSPAIKSLCVDIYPLPSSQVFDLMLSFPLLEDLNVITRDRSTNNDSGSCGPSTVIQPWKQPMSGSLELSQWGGIGFIASRLLSLPGGIRFRKLTLKWSKPEDILLTMALVGECSHTLEHLEIACGFLGASAWYPLPFRQLISDLQPGGGQTQLTSRRRRGSKIRFFGWNHRGLTGSSRLSERLHPANIDIFNKSQFTSLTTRPSPAPVPMSGESLEN